MAFDGFGTFIRLRSWVADAAAGVKIRADFHDDEDNNLAAGLTNCIVKDGQTTITQNIPFNSKRVTALADPVNPQDAATKAYADTKAPLAGGSAFTGDVIVKNADPTFTLNGQPGFNDAIYGQKNDKNRWAIILGDGTAETGGNAGSDFILINYADDGTQLSYPLFGARSTGLLTVKGDPTAALGIATKQYSDAASGSKLPLAGGTMTGQLTTVYGAGISSAGAVGTIQVMGSGNAGMTFHCPGQFLANFGLGSDGNFYVGGGSYGAVTYKIWTTKDFASLPAGNVTGVRLVGLGDAEFLMGAYAPVEPYGTSALVTTVWIAVDRIGVRYRQLQVQVNNGAWGVVVLQ